MGYGQNLKNILDEKGMTVKELAKKVGIAPTTLYSIIQRDTAVRFDTALKISHILNIPINSICKDNPYEPGETLPMLPSDNEKLMINLQKKAYFSDRTIRIVENFDYTELSIVDQLIADFFVLDDTTRSEVFRYLNILKNNHTNPERQKILDKIYQK
jgi:transcriptional regulator with XRE-family HTH domain